VKLGKKTYRARGTYPGPTDPSGDLEIEASENTMRAAQGALQDWCQQKFFRKLQDLRDQSPLERGDGCTTGRGDCGRDHERHLQQAARKEHAPFPPENLQQQWSCVSNQYHTRHLDWRQKHREVHLGLQGHILRCVK
jgi:hypothetical protein